MKEKAERIRVAVVGAGYSGMYCAKWLLEEANVDEVVIFEQTGEIGGTWVYREEGVGPARTTHSLSSLAFIHPSDFPFPEGTANFPSHGEMVSHLRRYAEHFELTSLVRFHARVEDVSKDLGSGRWLVRLSGGEEEPFDRVALCCGLFASPVLPTESPSSPWRFYRGAVAHSSAFKWADPAVFGGKDVLVVGGGAAAAEAAQELSYAAARCRLHARRGMWLHDRDSGGHCATDALACRALFCLSYTRGPLLAATALAHRYVWGRGGSGCPQLQPAGRPYLRTSHVGNRELVRGIIRDRVRPVAEAQPAAARLVPPKEPGEGGDKVDNKVGDDADDDDDAARTVWVDGEPCRPDLVLMATGFAPGFLGRRPEAHFEYVFDCEDPTLAVVGGVRAALGAGEALAELQARWVAAVWGARAALPGAEARRAHIAAERARHAEEFPTDHAERPTLVSHFEYADRIAAQFGARPIMWREYLTSTTRWMMLLYAPWTPFAYLVNERHTRERAFENMAKAYPHGARRSALKDLTYYFIALHVILAHLVLFFALVGAAVLGFRTFIY